MGQRELDSFNFEARENVVLFYRRRDTLYWGLLGLLVLAVTLVGIAVLADPPSGLRLRGRGAALAHLVILIPPLPRALVLAATLGWTLERLVRRTIRIYDRRPDLLIGPSGVADLDPWTPRALRWDEIVELRRETRRTTFRRRPVGAGLAFIGRPQAPWGLPRRTVDWLPARWTERTIRLLPRELDIPDEDVIAIARRFTGGRLVVREGPSPIYDP
ncbi:MAG: hypothetical protein HXX10_27655 [Rhodoplanes sp.]|uniref:hypothetical protein n=1 Tax=Rhodoplanes sp. TaxID=1968906 RepID=UPI0017FB0EC8|nr:hypothetical protein [Rhodoplanes sp.]NVO17814.1 hypothetical protein [Rhodoplanes sp.]